jgi:hypothetical protein
LFFKIILNTILDTKLLRKNRIQIVSNYKLLWINPL